MKGSIGTATYLSYTRPYWGKSITKLNYIDKLSPQAKVRYKAINLYSSGDYSLGQICEIFEINRSTFYRWRKRYKPSRVQSLEDRSRRPHKVRSRVVRNHQVEMWSEPLRLDTLSLNTPCIPESFSLPITSRIPLEADSLKMNVASSYYTHLQ